jgi:phospholipase/carboxylesterase
VERVKESAKILEKMNAKVHMKVYDGRPHTISQDEIEEVNHLIFK